MSVVDVRSAREFRSEAIATARSAPLLLVPTSVPLGAIDWALSRETESPPPFNPEFEALLKAGLGKGAAAAPQAAQALLICSNGARAKQAAQLLAEEGYDGLRWVEGGMAAWLEAYTPRGLLRKRVVKGLFRDTGNTMCALARPGCAGDSADACACACACVCAGASADACAGRADARALRRGRSWTDSAEEDTVLPATGGNTLDIVIDGE
jgi:rhodanese-related sulfurtransferase